MFAQHTLAPPPPLSNISDLCPLCARSSTQVYAPWCGHCKKLTPIYIKLAKRFAAVDSVVIAKMDGTENEHPNVEAKGYPTILFFPAGDAKKAIAFDGGDRSLKVSAGGIGCAWGTDRTRGGRFGGPEGALGWV